MSTPDPNTSPPCPAPGVRGSVRRRAFTLVELLVVVAVLGLLSGVIGACLAGGIRVWERVRRFNVVESQARIGLAIVTRDLMNGFEFFDVDFRGSVTAVSFAGLVRDEAVEAGDEVERIGTIEYVFDADQRALLRKAWAYPGDGDDSGVRVEEIVPGLENVAFSYCGSSRSGTGESVPWQGAWDSTNFPGAVRVEFTFPGESDESVTLGRTAVLAVGQPAGRVEEDTP